MTRIETGIVYLVGAGPGDPGLITVKGKDLLQSCDAVVYDSLIPDELIVTLPAKVEKHYVGKRGGKEHISQDEINGLLLKLSHEGKFVVRLKGSDPLIFGRGGEEARFLKKHNIPFEIVPGVTAAIAAAAYAGIPLTDREKASFVIFATGHKAKEKESSGVPWKQVARLPGGTLAIYMAVAEIERITGELLEGGMDAALPAAIIERGTFPTMRTIISTLGNLPQDAKESRIKAPAIFVVGHAIELEKTMEWISSKPLRGKRVMVTRPGHQAREMYERLRMHGAEVLAYPTIAVKEIVDDTGWKQLKNIMADDKWLLFTSENGVDHFIRQYLGHFRDIRTLSQYKIARMGYGTLRALQRHHLADDYAPEKSSSLALAEGLIAEKDIKGSTIIRVAGAQDTDPVAKMLETAGARVIPLIVYKTTFIYWPDESKEKLFEHPPDYIIFTSGRAVDGFMVNLDKDELNWLTEKAKIISIGKTTSKVIEACGLNVAYEARTPAIESVVDELAVWAG